jgi:hypothetical protein
MDDTAILPRIEDFRSDLDAASIDAARSRNLRALAMQAYLLDFPAFLHMRQLTEYIAGRRQMAPDEAPLGGWFLMRRLADATTTTVSPNVDTLYGASYVLLDRQGPVILQVPQIPDRYYSIALTDAYFDIFAVVGPRSFGNDGGEFLLVPPGWAGEVPEGVRAVLEAPTPSVCLLQRVYVRDAGEIDALHAVQDAIRLVPLAGRGDPGSAFAEVDVADLEVPGMREIRDPLDFFRLMNAYTGWNPPTGDAAGMAALFATAGLGPGSTLPTDPASEAAIRAGVADAQALMDARLTAAPVRDGWRVPDRASGLAGPDIAGRAATQATQMGILPLEEATYFFAYRDGAGEPLDGRNAYILTFGPGGLPPLQDLGFWSLTMYDERSLLVANPLDRYVIRPDTPGLARGADGSLEVYLSATRPAGVPDGNWLPAHAGTFNVALRAYLPQGPVTDGTWFPPGIVRTRTA